MKYKISVIATMVFISLVFAPKFAFASISASATITSVSPDVATAVSKETVLTIDGTGFGAAIDNWDVVCLDGTCYVNKNTGNEYLILWSDTQIKIKNWYTLNSPFRLRMDGINISDPIAWSGWLYLVPKIISITTSSKVYTDKGAAGSIATINGDFFTSTTGKVLFNGVEGTVQSWSNKKITAAIPQGATTGKITVKVYNQNSSDYSVVGDSADNLNILPTLSNDPLASDNQWWLSKIKANEAWSETTGSSNVVVAVIDSGVDINHIDLTNNIWTNQKEIAGNGKDDDNNGYIDDVHGWDFVGNINEISPYNSHGTHVAGIIAAAGNNTAGVSGTTWSTKIMPIAVCGTTECSKENIIKGIKYAAANGANIINLSLGGTGWTNDYTTDFDEAITYAYNKGVVTIAAAGNGDYTGAQARNLNISPNSPVCNDGGKNMVIGVAATDIDDIKASFSDYGSNCIDVSAPGKDIFSTVRPIDDPSYTANGQNDSRYVGYDKLSGTSMAAPMVSGLAALIKAKYPQANNRQIIDMIRRGIANVDSVNPLYAGQIGTGRIDIVKTLSLSPDTALTPPDNTIPVIRLKTSIKPINKKYYSANLTIAPTATDSFGTPAIYYKWGSGDYSKLKGKLIKAKSGKHTLHYYAEDEYGNKSEAKSVVYNVVPRPYEIAAKSQIPIGSHYNLSGPLKVFKVMNLGDIKKKPIRIPYVVAKNEKGGLLLIDKNKYKLEKLVVAYYDKESKRWISQKTAVSKKFKFIETKINQDVLFGIFVK